MNGQWTNVLMQSVARAVLFLVQNMFVQVEQTNER